MLKIALSMQVYRFLGICIFISTKSKHINKIADVFLSPKKCNSHEHNSCNYLLISDVASYYNKEVDILNSAYNLKRLPFFQGQPEELTIEQLNCFVHNIIYYCFTFFKL